MDGDKYITTIVSILTAIVGVAIVATLVSQKSNTPSVLQSAGSSFACILSTALSPLGGSSSCSSGGILQPFVNSTITFGDM